MGNISHLTNKFLNMKEIIKKFLDSPKIIIKKKKLVEPVRISLYYKIEKIISFLKNNKFS